jgi:CRISPR-associated protein Csy1
MSVNELTENIREYIAKRCTDRLEKLDKEAEKERAGIADSEAVALFDLAYAEKRQVEIEKYKPANWLTDASNRAKQISLVSHALKYTHSDAKGSSLLVTAEGEDLGYLATKTLRTIPTDVVGNAAALDVANLLLLDADGVKLLDFIRQQDATPLAPLSENNAQLETWLSGFSEALKLSEPGSHTLAKQVYFPLGDGEYHLLAPLASSSLTHSVYNRIMDVRFGEEAKALRDARKKGKYAEGVLTDFTGLATQSFGGTKPQNISLLNSQRRGRAFLFNAQPPSWKTKLTPLQKDTAFWSGYRYQVRRAIYELQDFIKANAFRESNMEIRAERQRIIQQFVDELHQYASRFWQLAAGWSLESDVTKDLACWLDPERSDEAFINVRESGDWQEKIAAYFARFLIGTLEKRKIQLSDTEHQYLKKQITKEASRFVEDLEVMV